MSISNKPARISWIAAVVLVGGVLLFLAIVKPGLSGLVASPLTPGGKVERPLPARTPMPGEHLPLQATCFGENALAGKDFAAAYQSFLSRAGKDARAEFHLGVMFRDGLGVLRNPRMAIERFLRAAEGGDTQAMTALGWMFSGDRDTGTNYVEAFRWYEKAALRGDPVAQFHLADMYAHGSGTKADKVAAYAWLSLLEDKPLSVGAGAGVALPAQGNLAVAEERHRVYQELTRDQVSQATRRVVEFREKVAATTAADQPRELQSCVQ